MAAYFPDLDLHVLALRIPVYERQTRALTAQSWAWLEAWAAGVAEHAAVVIGDLNASPASLPGKGGNHFRRLLASGWRLGTPNGSSYYSSRGFTSTPDHLLHTPSVRVLDATFCSSCGVHRLAGVSGALSDHAALVANLCADLTQRRGA